jgi:predicted dithiol-disulfide oxidoreductase (DUF899 family)
VSTDRPALPKIATREEWLTQRKALLAREKEVTRARDELGALRRRLPMVRIDKPYVFQGPNGPARLVDLFEGHRQLYVHHFMWVDARNEGCPGCSRSADLMFNDAHFEVLRTRDVAFAAISRAPLADITAYKTRKGWSFPWYSSHGTDFNDDFHVTLDPSRGPPAYNYRDKQELVASGLSEDSLRGDWPGSSVFLRDGENVFHTYSTYARGMDLLFTPYNFLDLTPFGRQEEWEDSPAGWPQRPTYG